MNDLKNLLISRIQDIRLLLQNESNHNKKQLKSRSSKNDPNYNNLDDEEKINHFNHNHQENTISKNLHLQNTRLTQRSTQQQRSQNSSKAKNKLYFIVKKRQKSRIKKQAKLSTILNNSAFLNQKYIQDFYLFSLQIFQSFDNSFSKYKNKSSFISTSMQLNLKKMYTIFFFKHDQQLSAGLFAPEIAKLQFTDLSPSFFISWIKKWSTNLLQSLLNLNEDDNEFEISTKLDIKRIKQKIHNKDLTFDIFTKKNRCNSFNFFSKNKSVIQAPHSKNMKQAKYKQTNLYNTFEGKISKLLSGLQLAETQFSIPINSKQIVYSYCLDEMKAYYKNYPLNDLDHGYLRGFKKVGRKDEILIGPNSKNAIQSLIESKNSSIQAMMNRFENEYKKFKIQQKAILKKQHHPSKKQSPSQNNYSFNKKETQFSIDQNNHRRFDGQGRLSCLNSKLLSPINKSIESNKLKSKHNESKNNKTEICQYRNNSNSNNNNKIGIEIEIETQNTFSNSIIQLKAQLINYNKIFTLKNNDQTKQREINIDILKRFNQKFRNCDDGQIWYRHKKNTSQQKCYQKKQTIPSQDIIDSSNTNFPKLPKLSLKGKSKYIDKKFKQRQEENLSFNQSELASNKKSYFHQKLNTQEIHDVLGNKSIRLQSFAQKPSGSIIGRRIDSEVSQKIHAQRSKSNFSINSKVFFGSKKPSLNMVKIPKNRANLNDEAQSFEIINAFKNKLKEKNSFNSKRKDHQILSNNSVVNIFSTKKVGLDQYDKKDQFIEYLKNLHREKIKSQVFKDKQTKSKQKQIKKKSP